MTSLDTITISHFCMRAGIDAKFRFWAAKIPTSLMQQTTVDGVRFVYSPFKYTITSADSVSVFTRDYIRSNKTGDDGKIKCYESYFEMAPGIYYYAGFSSIKNHSRLLENAAAHAKTLTNDQLAERIASLTLIPFVDAQPGAPTTNQTDESSNEKMGGATAATPENRQGGSSVNATPQTLKGRRVAISIATTVDFPDSVVTQADAAAYLQILLREHSGGALSFEVQVGVDTEDEQQEEDTIDPEAYAVSDNEGDLIYFSQNYSDAYHFMITLDNEVESRGEKSWTTVMHRETPDDYYKQYM